MTHKYHKIHPMISEYNQQWKKIREKKITELRCLEKFLLEFFCLFYNITFFAKICGEKQTSHILTKKEKSLIIFRVHERESVSGWANSSTGRAEFTQRANLSHYHLSSSGESGCTASVRTTQPHLMPHHAPVMTG